MYHYTRTCIKLSLFFLCAWAALAQYRASLQGTITDPQGNVIPAASVTLTSLETNITKKVETGEAGTYALTGLAPGRYQLTVEKPGFAKQEQVVQIVSEQSQAQDVQLTLASTAAQTVTVNASETPVIETQNAIIGATLSGQEIRNLPTFGRDPFQTLALAPGAFGDNARAASGTGAQNLPNNQGPGATGGTSSIFQTENQVQVVANGGRTESNSFQVDGVEVNSLAWGGAAVITPNQESVKEITVQSNPYSAENGRNSGAQVLVVSQNGTNEFHGSAMIKLDRPGLNAYQRWGGPDNAPPQRDTDRFNQYAGSLGGPIVKNHLFAFFSYETLRNDSTSTALNWYETPQFDSLVQSAVPASIASRFLGYPGQGASFNAIVPRTCADAGISNPNLCQPVFTNGQYAGLDVGSPLRSALGTADPGYVNNGAFGTGSGLDGIPDVFYVQTTSPVTTSPQQFNGRVDYQATSRDLITFSTYYVPVTTTSYNGPARAANLWHNDRLNESAALLWNHTISPSWLNEARFNVTRWFWNEITSNPQEPFGLPQANIDSFANTSVQAFGAPGPSIFNQTTYNFRDTVSSSIGRHTVKFGVDIYREQDNDNLSYAARPQYFFRNLWDFANDAPYQESGNFDPLTGQPSSATKYIRSAIWAGFIQDDFRVLPNLTINLGLRWEYFEPVHEKYGNISNAVLGTGANPLDGLSLKLGGDLYNSDYSNFAPQLGFAWRPNPASNRFVVRGGFGIGYNRMQEAVTLNGRGNPPLITSLTLSGANVLYAVPTNVNQFSGYPINPAAIQSLDPTTNLPTSGAPVTLNAFPQNLVTPRTYRYSLDTEYDLGGNWVAKLGYQGSQSRFLTVQTNLNLLYGLSNPAVDHLYWFYNGANSNYNALLTELQHNFAKNFQLDVQYRWSKAIDEGSNSYALDQFPFSLSYARGPSDFNVPHNVKVYGVWSPRIFSGNNWKEKVAGGWQLSGILNAHNGFPWSPLYANTGCNLVYANSNYCDLRPVGYNGLGGTDYSNSTFQQFNGNFPNGALNYFLVPGISATGVPQPPAVGRNSLRGPNYFDVDITVQKSFGLPKMKIFGENAKFTIRADLFNIFNKLNLTPFTPTSANNSNPAANTLISTDGTTSNPLFGQAQTALAGRIVEFQGRFSF
jgi:hypothetical protein